MTCEVQQPPRGRELCNIIIKFPLSGSDVTESVS